MATDALDPVVTWIEAAAHPLTTLDPAADLGDLQPLRPIVEPATVVGLGASTRQAHELLAVQHRIVRLLVRERFGRAYVAIGLTFDHGDAPYPVPPASPTLVDAVLARAGLDAYLLDLHAARPPEVDRWLTAPAHARLIGPRYDAARDADYHLGGAALADWFDAIVHVQEVTPAR